jgi:Asp/Glu/hydantoin racemase
MTVFSGGRNVYGYTVGVLMLQTQFPRIPGDVGNATTWPFPVLYRIVEGATPLRVVEQADPDLVRPFAEAARELVEAGCQVITTSCGFLAIFQRELAREVPAPVATSALLLVPMVARLLGPGQKVGILTARSHALTERHFNGVGWSSQDTPVVVAGMEDEPAWQASIGGNLPKLDRAAVEAAVVRKAASMVEREPGIGAFVLECTNLPPYAAALQRATERPVFDVVTLVTMLAGAAVRTEFSGVV